MVTTAVLPVKVIRHGHFFLDLLHLDVTIAPMPEQRTWLTAPQVAKLCGVDQKSVWNWMRKGLAPRHSMTPGGMAQFPKTAVAAWMAENDFRVPPELRVFLGERHLVKERLLAAVEAMTHEQRKTLLAAVPEGVVL